MGLKGCQWTTAETFIYIHLFNTILLFLETNGANDDMEDEILSINDDNHMDTDQVSIEPRLLSSGFYLFDCPHPQCVKQFRCFSNLESHLKRIGNLPFN